jgi:NAD(P)-dependent dehydrogenase (short-subunit alcohol dehydrogenase family)
MSASLSKRIAIVTGASHGYGIGIAKQLIEAGAKVWITARDKNRLEAVAKKIGAKAVAADVTIPADWDRVFETVTQKAGRIDILVNNAGAGIQIAPFAEQTDENIQKCIDVNLTGTIFGCKRAAPLMIKQKSGTIVNIASVCAIEAWPGWGVYSAAKAGLLQMTKSLYTELRPHGARATCLIPSWGATDFLTSASLQGWKPEIAKKCIKPDELGKVVVDICALPPHLVIQEMVLWPLVQEVIPL